MFSILAGLGGSLVKKLVPSAINWGVKKLMNTTIGQRYIPAPLMTGIGDMLSQAAVKKGEQIEEKYAQPPVLNMTQRP